MANITAREVAEKYGHTSSRSGTTLKTIPNPDADTDDGEIECMDLRVRGTGKEAFFEWVSEYGDPIGDRFVAIEEEEIVIEGPANHIAVERG